MKQYLDLCRRIVNEGEWVANERTGKRCLTVINADLEYDVANNSLVGDTLHLTSYQRSCDVPLGLNFNQIQVFTFLALMAQITGNKPGKAYHKIVNAHIYEDQLELMRDVQLKREPFPSPQLEINPDIKTLEDLETWVTMDDFKVVGYQSHEPIKYPFSV